jgi:hypothetical protein
MNYFSLSNSCISSFAMSLPDDLDPIDYSPIFAPRYFDKIATYKRREIYINITSIYSEDTDGACSFNSNFVEHKKSYFRCDKHPQNSPLAIYTKYIGKHPQTHDPELWTNFLLPIVDIMCPICFEAYILDLIILSGCVGNKVKRMIVERIFTADYVSKKAMLNVCIMYGWELHNYILAFIKTSSDLEFLISIYPPYYKINISDVYQTVGIKGLIVIHSALSANSNVNNTHIHTMVDKFFSIRHLISKFFIYDLTDIIQSYCLIDD